MPGFGLKDRIVVRFVNEYRQVFFSKDNDYPTPLSNSYLIFFNKSIKHNTKVDFF